MAGGQCCPFVTVDWGVWCSLEHRDSCHGRSSKAWLLLLRLVEFLLTIAIFVGLVLGCDFCVKGGPICAS